MPATVPEAGKGAEKLPAAIHPGLRIYSQTVRKRTRRIRRKALEKNEKVFDKFPTGW